LGEPARCFAANQQQIFAARSLQYGSEQRGDVAARRGCGSGDCASDIRVSENVALKKKALCHTNMAIFAVVLARDDD